jgi:phage baseplate assembly protein W
VGWAFPVKPVNGQLTFARYEDDVERAIPIILMTEPGERQMLPEFGAAGADQLGAADQRRVGDGHAGQR